MVLNVGSEGNGEIIVMSDNAVVGNSLCGSLKTGIAAAIENVGGTVAL